MNQRQKQCDHILALLRESGPEGVSKAVLLYDKHYSQSSARIFELERQGYRIRHETRPGNRYVTFVLISEPASAKLPEQQLEQGTFPLCDALERP